MNVHKHNPRGSNDLHVTAVKKTMVKEALNIKVVSYEINYLVILNIILFNQKFH